MNIGKIWRFCGVQSVALRVTLCANVISPPQEDLGLSESTYELCYNASCTLIGRGEYAAALDKLREAEG